MYSRYFFCYYGYYYSSAKHSAVSLSLLEESPQLKTLKHATYYVTQDASLSSSNTIYPEYSSFVGLRLDSQQTKGVDSNNKKGTTPIGIITVMDNKPMNKERVIFIQGILASVELRAKNEIERIRQGEHLIIAKNAALKDAENKIKFLADMSHEIRYIQHHLSAIEFTNQFSLLMILEHP